MSRRFKMLHETLVSQRIETEDILPINDDAYNSVINSLLKEDEKKAAQPALIVGESGAGKTFLVKRLYDAVERSASGKLQPIVIEGKSLYTTDEIWVQCASRLNLECANDCYNRIMEWQSRNSMRVVLFVDNIQYYFNRTDGTEQYGLRGRLNRAGAPILIAFSEKVLPAFTEYDAAFFDGFKIIYLKPLDISAFAGILNSKRDIVRLDRIMSYMPKTVRSMLTALEILERSDDSGDEMAVLSDFFSSRYQGKYDAAPITIQRILSVLALADAGLDLAEIRRRTCLDNGKISPYLKLLIYRRIISKETNGLRGGTYSITDPLFKLWLQHNIVSF